MMVSSSSFLSTRMIRPSVLSFTVALLFQALPQLEAGSVDVRPSSEDSMLRLDSASVYEDQPSPLNLEGAAAAAATTTTATTAFATNTTRKPLPPFPPSAADRERERQARIKRHRERRARAKDAIKHMRPENVEKVSEAELEAMGDHPVLRGLWGNSGGGSAIQYADPGVSWDMWQQGYRMLGGFIDCDHAKDSDHSGSGDQNNGGDDSGACSRWMMWASYIDPNYQGNGYYEYHGDEPTGVLDCHDPNTEWILLGVYRQEFYQFIEQISKHLWAIDEYEYVVALAGLAYMTDYDCFYVGTSNDGESIYAGVAPKPEGKFVMALYTDDYCLTPNNNLGMTFDDFGLYSNMQLQSGDGDDAGYDDDMYSWWTDTQEYTLTNLNSVYEEFKYCTSCIDYPTYQDGYVIGDDGMDDDDLINQCWKFYSHDSFNCESDCVALGHSQGTITSVVLDGTIYGEVLSSYYTSNAEGSVAISESPVSRLMANAFVTFSFIVFVATFLAFAVARRSRYRESRGPKSRRLLEDDDQRSPRSRRSTRSKSRTRHAEEGDGLFRTTESRKSRSKSTGKRSKSGRSKSVGKDRDTPKEDKEYDPPRTSGGRSSRSKSKSRRQHIDDF